jgi:hypothetical protein
MVKRRLGASEWAFWKEQLIIIRGEESSLQLPLLFLDIVSVLQVACFKCTDTQRSEY